MRKTLALSVTLALVTSSRAADLTLQLDAGSDCVQPGETVSVTLSMANLAGSGLNNDEASGFQAFLAYNATNLSYVSASYTASPFGLVIISGANINPSPGEINLAAGIDQLNGQSPTSLDADLVTITFTANAVVDCTGTPITFRAHTPPTAITDVNGDSASPLNTNSSAGAVIDGTPPTPVCQNVTVQLDAFGSASITPAQIDFGSTDNCAVDTLSLDITTFDCSDVGANTVTLTVTDCAGNSATCQATVTVQDVIGPSAVCQDITVQLDAAGTVTIVGTDVDGGSTDDCGVQSLGVSPDTFTCADVGPNVVTLTVTDVGGNTAQCTATVTVEDSVDPTAVCQDITVQLDAAGVVTITGNDVDGGSTDACGILSLGVAPDTFTCADVGPNVVTLTVTDVNGNTSQCSPTVTVEDVTAPAAICQDITVQLDAAGAASIVAGDVDAGSTDACGVDSLVIDVDTFSCLDVGPPVVVTLTVTDVNGNQSQCAANVTVEDNVLPSITCPTNVTVNADAGECTADAANVSLGTPLTSDNCGVASVVNDAPAIFPQGDTIVTWTVTDDNGNLNTCPQTVTVTDQNEFVVSVALAPAVVTPLTRCISFEFHDCVGGSFETVEQDITFVNGLASNVLLTIPCGDYVCVTARDARHTLRRTDEDQFGVTPIVANQYVADFTDLSGGGGDDDSLIGGNLNDDVYIDILDFGIFSGQWMTSPIEDACGTPAPSPHADISGDGTVFTEDFTFIQINFLRSSETDCCVGPASNQVEAFEPVTQISVGQLWARGLGHLSASDLNGDGWLDQHDVAAFLHGVRPQVQAVYDGPEDGSWLDPANWTTGLVPTAGMDVLLSSPVMIDAAGAEARDVTIAADGALRLFDGVLLARTLTVQADATLTIDGDVSLLAVDSLVIEPGAVLNFNGGVIEIAGGRYEQAAPDLFVASGPGASTLRLLDGAEAAIARHTFLGFGPESLGVLEVMGSGFSTGATLFAGYSGEAWLEVGDGGLVSAEDALVGVLPEAVAEVRIDGPGSGIEVINRLEIGRAGHGTLHLVDGGVAAAGSEILIGRHGAVIGEGRLEGPVRNAGQLVPTGTVRITGPYRQDPGGELSIELRHDGHDTLVIEGPATLGGILRIEAAPGLVPAAGERYTVLVAPSRSGLFESVLVPELGGGAYFQLQTGADSVWLVVKETPSRPERTHAAKGGKMHLRSEP